ncbi:MAG TPA: MnhB domain-containing protein [Candidatus Cloacimonadota bacterium]|nr:MnhB domain-containing protein [Candidatus Cloacimonadota bacterium]
MIKYLLVFVAVLGIGWILWQLGVEFQTAQELNPLAAEYVRGSTSDLNMPNAVTAVVVSYRGLDTLGEVTVLFLATAGIGFLLKRRKRSAGLEIDDTDGAANVPVCDESALAGLEFDATGTTDPQNNLSNSLGSLSNSAVKTRTEGSEILKTGANMLVPMIVVLGIYIFTHGHLSPGGGFQGGVVIASGILMLIMAETRFHLSHLLLHISESLSGLAYVAMGLAGLILLGVDHFLDPRYLLAGQFLALFSAGAVPVIYSLIGIKVGSELASVLASIQHEGEEL